MKIRSRSKSHHDICCQGKMAVSLVSWIRPAVGMTFDSRVREFAAIDVDYAHCSKSWVECTLQMAGIADSYGVAGATPGILPCDLWPPAGFRAQAPFRAAACLPSWLRLTCVVLLTYRPAGLRETLWNRCILKRSHHWSWHVTCAMQWLQGHIWILAGFLVHLKVLLLCWRRCGFYLLQVKSTLC